MKLKPSSQCMIALLLMATPLLCASGELLSYRTAALQHLGIKLFFDRGLSRNADVSCASCHQPKHAFTDGRSVAIGTDHQMGTRNTPSLLSLGKGPFFWDGRTGQLEEVVPQPFTNPVEMGLASETDLLTRLRHDRAYTAAFIQAFSDSNEPITMKKVGLALAAYVGSLGKGVNAYERYAIQNDQNALSPNAKQGLILFQGTAGCVECHMLEDAKLGDGSFHTTLINTTLAPILPAIAIKLVQTDLSPSRLGPEIESDPKVSELGRFIVTHDPNDIGAFRTPSLRNVALTAPYMHDGSVATLREAVDREIYYRNLQSNRPNTLTEQDRQDLVVFLESLSDLQ